MLLGKNRANVRNAGQANVRCTPSAGEENNPIKYTDPMGLAVEADDGLSSVVVKGDPLSQIVEHHNDKWGSNLSVDDVAKFNDIINPNIISAGSTLKFPGEQLVAAGGEGFKSFEVIVGSNGCFEISGASEVTFGNGTRSFSQKYDVLALKDAGFSIGVDFSGDITTSQRTFPRGISNDKVAKEYEGRITVHNGSLGLGNYSVFSGSGWRGQSLGVGFSFGSKLAISKTITQMWYSRKRGTY